MSTAETKELKQLVDSLEWYHTVDLGHGIVTPGFYDHRPYLELYGLPEDLSGKTALDIGTASGFFAFEMERRGAKVTAIDLPEWIAHDFGPLYQPDKTPEEARCYLHEPFFVAKRALGSKVKRREINVYDISPQIVGVFDLVFCGSVLLHLTDPIRALWRIQSVTKESAIIATAICHEADDLEPLAVFAGHHRGDIWWLPNRACLEALVKSAGFASWEWLSEFRLDSRGGQPGLCHGVIQAWNAQEPAAEPGQDEVVETQQIPTTLSLAEVAVELSRLRELVVGYEQGRFIRLMRFIDGLRRRTR
jgi:tRNA (mo5U34)-methyltransferase